MEEVIIENQNLIYSIANYFSNINNKEDLFQVGVIGMINAYNNYDPASNTKFTTYAYMYILGEMKKYIRETRLIKVSKSISSLGSKVDKAYELLSQKLKRYPTNSELASFLSVPEYLIADVISSRKEIKSIDSTILSDSKELSLHEIIPDKQKDINSLIALKEELLKLDEKDRELLKNRYYDDMTQMEVANKLGISQVKVSREEKKVLTKLKQRIM